MATNKPEFLVIGAVVRVQHWFGEVVDIAISDTRIMILVKSPKAIWRNHLAEWVEFDPAQVGPAVLDQALQDADLHIERITAKLQEAQNLRNAWAMK